MGGGFKALGQAGAKAFQDGGGFGADYGVQGAGHPQVADIGSAAGQDAGVGGGDMGVGADDGADAAVKVPAQGLFFGGRFGVKVHYHDAGRPPGFPFRFGKAGVGFPEGAVDGRHKDASLQVQHHRFAVHQPAPAGGAVVVGGAQQRQFVKVGDDFLFVPDVVAGGHHIHAGGQQAAGGFERQAETAGGIFRIGDDQVDGQFAAQGRQQLRQSAAAGPADDVAYHQDAHCGCSQYETGTGGMGADGMDTDGTTERRNDRMVE